MLSQGRCGGWGGVFQAANAMSSRLELSGMEGSRCSARLRSLRCVRCALFGRDDGGFSPLRGTPRQCQYTHPSYPLDPIASQTTTPCARPHHETDTYPGTCREHRAGIPWRMLSLISAVSACACNRLQSGEGTPSKPYPDHLVENQNDLRKCTNMRHRNMR